MDSTNIGKNNLSIGKLDNIKKRLAYVRFPKIYAGVDCAWKRVKEAVADGRLQVTGFENIKLDEPLLICGENPGSGKTFMACALGKVYIIRGCVVKYMSIEDFLDLYRNQEYAEIKNIMEDAIIIWDNLINRKYTDWEKEIIGAAFRRRLEYLGKPDIIVTGFLEDTADDTLYPGTFNLISRNSNIVILEGYNDGRS